MYLKCDLESFDLKSIGGGGDGGNAGNGGHKECDSPINGMNTGVFS
jgi:hypothetical protein